MAETLYYHEMIGPTETDIKEYRELVTRIEAGETFDFEPRVNAELTSMRLDDRRLGIFTNSDVAEHGLDDDSRLKLAQQRYIAGLLGFVVGPTEVNKSTHTAHAVIRLPQANELPPLPVRQPDGTFVDEHGSPLSAPQVDMRYSAQFLAANHDNLSRPNALESSFKRVFEQAENGVIEVRDKVGNVKGAMSFVRQSARAMGYNVDDFEKDYATGTHKMIVDGVRPGFEVTFAHFPRN